jgi:predicted solute-binding protein
MSVTIEEKTIETKIMEKKKAEEKYDDAVAAGNTAAKMSYDEEVPDVLNLNLGQL